MEINHLKFGDNNYFQQGIWKRIIPKPHPLTTKNTQRIWILSFWHTFSLNGVEDGSGANLAMMLAEFREWRKSWILHFNKITDIKKQH